MRSFLRLTKRAGHRQATRSGRRLGMESLEDRSLLSGVGLGPPQESLSVLLAATPLDPPPSVAPNPVDENATTTLTGSFVDSTLDEHTVAIDWGDGQTSTLDLAADVLSFSQDHQYADNLLGNAPYTINVSVTDLDGDAREGSAEVVVNNVPPVASVVGPTDGVRGQPRILTLNATDASPVDQAAGFDFTLNWGDGSPTETRSGPSGMTVDHVFADVGTFTVQVTATDKDGGTSNVATHTITITAVGLQDDPLYPGQKMLAVGGTAANDSIVFNPGGRGRGVKVLINGASQGVFQPTSRIVAFGQDGNDNIQVAGGVRLAAWLFGGGGNDRLHGGAGNDLLFGGLGNDQLLGGQGRDLLVGGAGADQLNGNAGDDILIGDSLNLDDAALRDVMAVWTSSGLNFNARVAALSATLTPAVQNDGERDNLVGASGQNWLIDDLGMPKPKGPPAKVVPPKRGK